MFNNKPLLYGMGSGLIVGAILLQLMNAVMAPAAADPAASGLTVPKLEEMDSQELKKAASAYFNVYEKSEVLYTQKQADELVQQRLKEEAGKQPAPAPPAKETSIYISKGQTATQVAEMLQLSGVVTNRQAFEEAMNRQRLTDKIVSGTHIFVGQPELAQVISQITTQ